jgi:hypothetical protein
VFGNKVLKETLRPYNMLREWKVVEILNLGEEGYSVVRKRCGDETGRSLICELKEGEKYMHKLILWNPPVLFSSFLPACLEIARRLYMVRPCDELITRPRSPTDCLRSRKPK